tara:strand:- start:58 stop:360 length:303 start_codon:yes stop_codon:yes gene_type:complete
VLLSVVYVQVKADFVHQLEEEIPAWVTLREVFGVELTTQIVAAVLSDLNNTIFGIPDVEDIGLHVGTKWLSLLVVSRGYRDNTVSVHNIVATSVAIDVLI